MPAGLRAMSVHFDAVLKVKLEFRLVRFVLNFKADRLSKLEGLDAKTVKVNAAIRSPGDFRTSADV